MEHRTEMFPSYTSADLMDIKTPILVIVAENDRRIKPDHTIKMANLLPNSRMELVNGAAHFGIIKRKKTLDVVVEHIFDFLK